MNKAALKKSIEISDGIQEAQRVFEQLFYENRDYEKIGINIEEVYKKITKLIDDFEEVEDNKSHLGLVNVTVLISLIGLYFLITNYSDISNFMKWLYGALTALIGYSFYYRHFYLKPVVDVNKNPIKSLKAYHRSLGKMKGANNLVDVINALVDIDGKKVSLPLYTHIYQSYLSIDKIMEIGKVEQNVSEESMQEFIQKIDFLQGVMRTRVKSISFGKTELVNGVILT